MSQYYRAGDTVLWNPSSGASRVFLGLVRLFEAELSLPSGVGPMEADECQVQVDHFRTFAQSVLTYRGASNHQILHALMDGFVITVLALAELAGAEVRPSRFHGRQYDLQPGSEQAPSEDTEDELLGGRMPCSASCHARQRTHSHAAISAHAEIRALGTVAYHLAEDRRRSPRRRADLPRRVVCHLMPDGSVPGDGWHLASEIAGPSAAGLP